MASFGLRFKDSASRKLLHHLKGWPTGLCSGKYRARFSGLCASALKAVNA
jgi:hypothetical protein